MAGGTDIWKALLESNRIAFTTREAAALTGSHIAATSQCLTRLSERGIITKVMRGVWALVDDRRFTPFVLVSYVCGGRQAYISFITAMHLHGMIGQIPQTITVASLGHSRTVATPVASFALHQIEPGFFDGFEWSDNGLYLVATPEKALTDSLYIASRRGKRYASFPEIEFPRGFSEKRALAWVERIRNIRLRSAVAEKLKRVLKTRAIDRRY